MTKNVKKLLAVVLVLVMAGSTMIVAWANNPPEADSDAEIYFMGWQTPDGPHEPEDETVPPPGLEPEDLPEYPTAPDDGDDLNDLAGSGLQFWNHNITTLPTTGALRFNSVRALNTASPDGNFASGGFHATLPDPALDYSGIDTTGHTSYAGMIFRFLEGGWGIQVEMSEFTITGSNDPAINGPELTLVRAGTPFGNFAPLPDANDVINARTVLSPDAQGVLIPHTATENLSLMWFGHNFSGELHLAGGRSDVEIIGSATADLTWTTIFDAPTG